MYIELKNIKYAYDENIILDDISFGIEKGEITGLIGENGAGKTTTILNLIKKLIPKSGSINIDGMDLNNIKIAELKTAYIPDQPVYYEELTLLEHLYFVQALYPHNSQNLEKLIEQFELKEHLNKIPSMLSKGTLQKMMISLALIRNYEFLIADEPFSGLDPKQIKLLKNILKENRTKNKAILISTHLLDLVEELCDKYVMIHRGQIIANGTKKEIIHEHGLDGLSTLEDIYLSLINK